VGTMAIQIAKSRGCRVIATASGKNQDVLREMKADVCVDYETQRFEEFAKDVDVVLDMVGGETRERSWGCLKKGGMLVSIVGQPDAKAAAEHGVKAVGILVKPDSGELGQIAALIDEGKIKPAPTRVMPLREAAEAQVQAATRHTRGKIVLRPE
jgi:NADPH:quinone reductase-like Zn-dependent oxidoreductase